MKILIAGREEETLNYQKALQAMGIPFDVRLSDVCHTAYDGLLLPGGGDIDPARFGQELNGSTRIDPELDGQQFSIFRDFFDAGKPVFGICRGCQIINVALGGTMIQHLPCADTHKGIVGGGDFYHSASAEPGSVLYGLYGGEFSVNSHHHQGCDRIGEGLKCTLRAADGTVEAVEHESRPVLGVQWHPERTGFDFLSPKAVDGEKLFRYFINEMIGGRNC